MPRFVAFLRAINVTGRFVKMAVLAEHGRALGLADVQTHIQSGNLIFDAPARQAATLAARLEAGLAPLLGFTTEAFVRTPAEVQALAEHGARLRAQVGEAGDVNVIFLGQPLTPGHTAAVQALRNDIDDFACTAREVLWLCRTRQSESRLSNAVLERTLRQRCTLRRASMLQTLSERLAAGAP